MENREPSYTVGGNADWYSHYGKTVWRFLKKLEIELPYDPAIPLLGIHTKGAFVWFTFIFVSCFVLSTQF